MESGTVLEALIRHRDPVVTSLELAEDSRMDPSEVGEALHELNAIGATHSKIVGADERVWWPSERFLSQRQTLSEQAEILTDTESDSVRAGERIDDIVTDWIANGESPDRPFLLHKVAEETLEALWKSGEPFTREDLDEVWRLTQQVVPETHLHEDEAYWTEVMRPVLDLAAEEGAVEIDGTGDAVTYRWMADT